MKLVNDFLGEQGNVNKGSARTVSVHLADFEQFVKIEYREDPRFSSRRRFKDPGKLDLYEPFSKFVMYER